MTTTNTTARKPATGLNFAKPIVATAELDGKSKGIIRAVSDLLSRDGTDPGEVFGEFCERLRKRYELARAILFLATDSPKAIQSYALWENGQSTSGVMVTIPEEDSALWELLETGFARSFTPARLFSGNIFERKLCVGSDTGALLLWPLVTDNGRHGLVAFNTSTAQPLTASDPLLKAVMKSLAEYLAGARALRVESRAAE